MARTINYSKEDILEKSVDFIKEQGYSKLTVRELANYIGCSTQPIFKNYANFDMYKEDFKFYLRKDYSAFIYKRLSIYNKLCICFLCKERTKCILYIIYDRLCWF